MNADNETFLNACDVKPAFGLLFSKKGYKMVFKISYLFGKH